MSDNTLGNLMGRIPQRCILLLEVSILPSLIGQC